MFQIPIRVVLFLGGLQILSSLLQVRQGIQFFPELLILSYATAETHHPFLFSFLPGCCAWLYFLFANRRTSLLKCPYHKKHLPGSRSFCRLPECAPLRFR